MKGKGLDELKISITIAFVGIIIISTVHFLMTLKEIRTNHKEVIDLINEINKP